MSGLAELRIVLREHALAPAALALSVLGAFATWNGERWLDERERVQAAVEAERAPREQAITDGLAAIERGEPVPEHMREAMPLWWRFEVFGVEPRDAFALTALGARDLAPPTVEASDRRMGDAPPDEQRNPALLASGRFDLAFLVTLLLPWFAIALAHRLAAGERESGRWPLLESSARAPWLVLAQRAAWIVGVLTLAAGGSVALTLAALGRFELALAPQWLAWTATSAAVLGVWCALALAIERLERSATFNLGALGSAWVLLCWVAPVAVGEWVTRHHPVDSRTELARLARKETYSIWDERAKYTQGVFDALGVREQEVAEEVRTAEWKERLQNIAYSFEAVRRIGPAAERLVQQRRARAELERSLAWLSPALAAQQVLLALAGSAPLERMAFEDALQRRHELARPRLARALVFGRDLAPDDWRVLRGPLELEHNSPLARAAGPALVLSLWLLAAAIAFALLRPRSASNLSPARAEHRAATA